jgi:hypothetical protein
MGALLCSASVDNHRGEGVAGRVQRLSQHLTTISSEQEAHLRTVLVSKIPSHLRSANKITTYFKNVYPEAVRSVSIAQNLLRQEWLYSHRTSVLAEIEHELLTLCRNEKRNFVEHSTWDKWKITMSSWNQLEKVAAMALAEENHYIMWWDNTLWLWQRECTICKKNSDTGSKTETRTTLSSLIFYVKAILIWKMNTKVVIKYTNAHEYESYYVRNMCGQFLLLFNKHQRTLCPSTSR